jgi:hypothetical protein
LPAKATAALCAALLLFGCTTYRGVEEFTLYQSAFEKTVATSTSILDQLAVKERALFQSHHRIKTEADVTGFDPALATYYTDSVDPPGTAAFRRSLDTVKTYNDLLYGLASGQTAAALVARIGELGSNVGKAAANSAGLVSFASTANLADLGKLAKGMNVAFTELQPFLTIALGFRSRDEFRRYLVANYPKVRNILVAIRNGTSVIFPILTADILRRARVDPNSGALTAPEIEKIGTYQKLLADWVVLLDGTCDALDRAVAAVAAAPTVSGSISSLNQIAVDLEGASQAARKHLAELAAQ